MPASAVSAPLSAAPSRALVGRGWDPLLLGGFSLAVPLGVAVLYQGGVLRHGMARLEHWLAVLIVLPHFLSSYRLFYWDWRGRLKEPTQLFAGVAVPLILAAVLSAIYLTPGAPVPLWLVVQGMFLLSGWHYLKQSFGCAIVSCALSGSPLSNDEKLALRANLLAMGALAYLSPNCGPRGFTFVGLPYQSLNLPYFLVPLGYAALAAAAARLVLLLRKREKPLPGSAWASVAGFYAWTAPILINPDLFYTFRFVPFAAALHSLQYMTFVLPLRWRMLERAEGGEVSARSTTIFALGWAVTAVFLGPFLFYTVPGWFDARLPYDHARLGPLYFIGAVHLFVNIHHYFIDSVMWRRDNADLGELIAHRSRVT
jgi:hypothetical protein